MPYQTINIQSLRSLPKVQGARIVRLAAAIQRLYPLAMIRFGARHHYWLHEETLRQLTRDPGKVAVGAAPLVRRGTKPGFRPTALPRRAGNSDVRCAIGKRVSTS